MADKFIIYGGSGGVGSCVATLLHERGAQLHLVGRDEERLAKVADQTDSTYTAGDVNDPDLFAKVTADSGDTCNGLVYAVGTINLKNLNRLGKEDFLADFQINAAGAALAVQAAQPALKKSGHPASVVLYSSVAALQGFTAHTSVGMAKGAVNGLVLSLAAELAPKVRVNAVAPSLTQTPLAAGLLANETVASALAQQHPMQRLGTPDDIAHLTAFLLSPEAAWITGQIISVDGGRSTVQNRK